ncbi:MAG: cytochrome c biogenesis CcdA family protein [Chloroflexota bacterium]
MDLTLGAALFAGLISFLSPCVLPVVPAYLGQLGVLVTQAPVLGMPTGSAACPGAAGLRTPPAPDQSAGPVTPAMLNAVAFVLGFGIVFTALGLSLNAATSLLRDHQALLRQIGGILLIVLGLNLMGVIRIPLLMRTWRPVASEPALGQARRTGVLGGLALGVVFALGWTPCIGPTLGAILTMAAVSSGPQVAALLVAYCLGLGVPFLVLAVAADRTPAITRSLARHGRTIELIGGGLVVVMGVAILFDWLSLLSNAFVAFWPQV